MLGDCPKVKNFGDTEASKVQLKLASTFYPPEDLSQTPPENRAGVREDLATLLLEKIGPGETLTRRVQVYFPQPGKHVVQAMTSGAYRIGGYFDAVLEYSVNNGVTYRPADRPLRVQLANPPCGNAAASLNTLRDAIRAGIACRELGRRGVNDGRI